MAVQLLISGNSTKGGASYAAPRTNAKGRGKIAGRLLAAVPQDTRPDAAPVDFSVPAMGQTVALALRKTRNKRIEFFS